mgnify:CR=1 FL=1
MGFLLLFFFERLFLYQETGQEPLLFVNLLGHGINLHPQSSSRFIDQINRLIRQKSVRDIAGRQLHCRNKRIVGNIDTVEEFIFFFQSPQD